MIRGSLAARRLECGADQPHLVLKTVLQCLGVNTVDVMEQIKGAIESNSIILFMKGSPQLPQCGFSSRTVQALQACGADFAYVDVLAHPEIRANLPQYANWPTFPQLYINGELVGGCDITLELFESGELQKMVQEATTNSTKE
jgi:monothiol glutaredoxin